MDESIDAPEPPRTLPDEAIAAVDSLTAPQLRTLVTYARSRVGYLETSIADLVEPDDEEEILHVEEYDLYTVVVKGRTCEDGCDACPDDPHVYVVTIEPDLDGDRHLHWEDLGRTLGDDP